MSETPLLASRPELAHRLTTERSRLGYSEAQFATLMGLSAEDYRKLEAGTRALDPELRGPLHRMGVDIRYLIDGRLSTCPPEPADFPCWVRSAEFYAGVELLRKSVQAVNAFVGDGAAERSPELVAALMNTVIQARAGAEPATGADV